MGKSWRVIGRIARDRQLRRIELGFAGFSISEHATWLASMVYAYERGGVGEAGIASLILLAPGLIVAPIGSFAGDRFESGRVLASGYALQAIAMLLTALAIAGDFGRFFVYGAAALTATAVTLTRPALGAVLPNTTHTPADLTAANVVLGFVEYTGMFIGPALAGVLISVWGVAAPFAMGAALATTASVLAFGVRTVRSAHAVAAEDRSGILTDTVEGLRALKRHSAARLVIGMLSLGSLVKGAADVLFVATAAHLADGDTSRAGLFGTAFGLGAVVGSAMTVMLVGRARLTPSIAMAVAGMGLALAALASDDNVGVALVLFAVIGAGESVLRVSASTLIQRVSPPDVVGRFFGVAEGLQMSALAIGALAIGLLVSGLDYQAGLLASGLAIPILLLLRISKLFRVDRDAVAPDERVLELILGDDIFNALPAPTIERLSADAERVHVAAGDVVMTEGDEGDRYYVIDTGQADVTIAGVQVNALASGAGFGELALLRNSARLATVTATTDLELLAFEREHFLQAVTGHSHSAAIARDRTDRYLGTAPQ